MVIDSLFEYTSSIDGNGVYTKDYLKKGTIIMALCNQCQRYSMDQLKDMDKNLFRYLDEFGYYMKDNSIILPCKPAHKMNHSCNPNTMHAGFDFFVVNQDVLPNSELTIDYQYFMYESNWSFECNCNEDNCREVISNTKKSLDISYSESFKLIPYILTVDQPLHMQLLQFSRVYPLINEIKLLIESDGASIMGVDENASRHL